MNHVETDAVAWALVHFVWQGAAIALAAGFVNVALRRARPQTRYALFCGALAMMVLAPVMTMFVVRSAPSNVLRSPVAVSALPSPSTPSLAAIAAPAASSTFPELLPWLVRIWLSGVVILTLRALGGWVLAHRLTRWRTSPAAEHFQRAAKRLRERLNIRRNVRILTSAMVEIPATIGWLRPVVLLPISALTSLTPEHIELLLAHELAHIRRHDYLVNLVQTAVCTVLFYHPAVWWVSGRIRAEREHCCDDLAVCATGSVAAYANALYGLERARANRPGLALAADGGSLLARIQRLSNGSRTDRNAPPAWIGGLLPAAVVLAAVFSVAPPEAVAESAGFLRGLAEAGYTNVSVDEIIALKENGVEPRYIEAMLRSGLARPGVRQLIKLRGHGVEPEFVASVVKSGLLRDLDVESVVRLHENGVDGDEMGRIRALGFGPYSADEVIRLRQHGVDAETFEALLTAGMGRAGVDEALKFRENGITLDRIRSMKQQGFNNLSLEQIVKLSRGGII